MSPEPRRYFSQNGEDYLLWAVLGDRTDGFYVDVGAFDGVYLSNSYSFELAGWRGVCIEPLPAFYERCRAARPGAACVHAACVADPAVQHVELYVEEMGLLSGLDPEREAELRERYERRGLEWKGFERVQVPAFALTAILEQHAPAGTAIDFISVDVEGAELDVLRGLDLDRYAPRLLVIEANTLEAERILTDFLGAAGFHRARRVGENVVFCRDRGDVQRAREVAVDCRLEPMTHPLGGDWTIPGYAAGKQVHLAAGEDTRIGPKDTSLAGRLARNVRRMWRDVTGAGRD